MGTCSRRAGLWLVGLALASCSPRAVTPTPAAAPVSTIERERPGDELLGTYACTLSVAEQEAKAPCRIARRPDGLHFELDSELLALSGSVEPGAFGFTLRGRAGADATFEARVYEQGGNRFASVFALPDQRLVRLSLRSTESR